MLPLTKQTFLFWLRITGTTVLLAVLLWRADLPLLLRQFADVKLSHVATAAGLLGLRNLLQAARWSATLRAWHARIPLARLMRTVLMGHFFTLLLPTSTGGDVARWGLVARQLPSRTLAGQSVAADRLLGLAGLGALLIFLLPWSWSLVPSTWLRAGLLLVLPLTTLLLAAVLYPGWLPTRWQERFKLQEAYAAGWILCAMGLSLVTHVVAILAIFALGRAVGDQLGLKTYATLLPLVWMLSMLPIAIGGLGVREAGFVALFSSAGMPEATATAVAALWLALTLLQAATGSLLLVLKRRRRRRAVTSPSASIATAGQAD